MSTYWLFVFCLINFFQVKQNTKISEFFKNVDLPVENGDAENKTDNAEVSKKRRYSICQEAGVTPNINTNKTPTKNTALFNKTPSPLKSPLQKKLKNNKRTPVKNLFKQHVAGLSSFNVSILERLVIYNCINGLAFTIVIIFRFVKQSPEKTVTRNLVAELESCKLSSTNSIVLEDNKKQVFEEDSWDADSFSAVILI